METLKRASEALARPKTGLIAILSFVAFFFLLFCAVDNRPPDDHDDFYTANSTWALDDYGDAGLFGKPFVLLDHFSRGELHPRLSQTTLVATLGTFGRTRFTFRATNLPYYLLLVFGTFLLAREISGDRLGLLAAFVVANTPMIINYSRKWDIQFHAAALTPLGLYLGLAALRAEGRRATKLWLAFGCWQGVRLYTHPIVVSDIVVTFGLIGLVLYPHGRATRRPLRPRLAGYALAVGATFVTGLYYFGIAGSILGEPAYSLHNYLVHRGSYSDTTFWLESDALAKASHLFDLLSEVVWVHLLPLYSMLLLPGILLLPLLLLGRRAWANQPPGGRWLTLVVAGSSAAQIPPIALATSNRAFLNDWLFLAPGLVVLSLVTLHLLAPVLGAKRDHWVAVWTVALVAAGVAHHAIPLGARLVGPDPIEDPGHYDNLLLGPFTRSSSGRHYTTHHVPSRFPFAGDVVAERVAERSPTDGPGSFTLLDLTWDPALEGRQGCVLGPPETPDSWLWKPPHGVNVWAREVSPWPFVFEGFSTVETVRPDHTVDARASSWSVYRPVGTVAQNKVRMIDGEETAVVLGGHEEQASGSADPRPPKNSPPTPEQPKRSSDQSLPPTAVVRLWMSMAHDWERGDTRCFPDERLPEGFIAMADSVVSERFPTATRVGTLPDPTGWLVARAVEWDRTRGYVGTALMYDLGD